MAYVNYALAVAVMAGAVTLAGPATADNAMKLCGAKYQAAKAGKTLPAGQTWNQFLAQCRGTLTPASTPVATARPAAAAKASTPARPAGQPSAAMTAMHARQRQCGQQWAAAKAAGKVPAGQKWPQYWSQCNARLKS